MESPLTPSLADNGNGLKQARLTREPVRQSLVRLAVPMLWGLFAIFSMQLVDAYFVAQLGTDALTAISYTIPATVLTMNLAMGLGIGASSVISRAIGAGNDARMRRLATDSLLLVALVMALLCIIGLYFHDPIFLLLGADPGLLPMIHAYMVWWFPGSILLGMAIVSNTLFRAAGNSLAPSIALTTVALVNMMLDPLLIFGIGPFPECGISGAAIASLIADGCGITIALIWMWKGEHMLTYHLKSWTEIRQSWRDILHVGIPAAGTQIILPLTDAIIIYLLSSYGNAAVAAYGIASRVESFALLPIIALMASLGPFIGQNWGAGQSERIQHALRISYGFSLIAGLLIATMLYLTAEPLAALFRPEDDVIRYAAMHFTIIPISYGLLGILMNGSAALNAIGRPTPAMIVTLMRAFGLYIPLAWLLHPHYGVAGIFTAAAIANGVVGLATYVYCRRCTHMLGAKN